MNCPGCGEVMIIVEWAEVEIDYCLRCGGVWLDAGELELLLAGSLTDSKAREHFLAAFHHVTKTGEKKRKCPRCHKVMAKVQYGQELPVLFDKCVKEHGIFLDQGELAALLTSAGMRTDEPVFTYLKTLFQGN